jgi:PAS domain S-box-containing protein
LRLLIVEDAEEDAELLIAELRDGGYEPSSLRVEDAAGLREALRREWDIVLSDFNLPAFDAMEAFGILRRSGTDVPFIIVSGYVGEETAVELIKAGATDFVMKSNLARLVPAVDRSLKEALTRRLHRSALEALHESDVRFRSIASSIPGIVYQASFTENHGLKFLYINQGSEPLLGLPPQALLDRPDALVGCVVPEDRVSLLESWSESRRTGRQQNWEGRIRADNGDVKWVNLRAGVRVLPTGEAVSEGIIINITNRRLAEIEAVRSREQLRELSRHVETVMEDERARIAREIHDVLGSTLTAAKIDLQWLWQRLQPDATELIARATTVESLLDQAMDLSRAISRSLRPAVLDHGITAAIEWQVREFEKRLKITGEFVCLADEPRIEAQAATALFRILQETLTNVARHAGASCLRVELLERDQGVLLRIEDDGYGVKMADLAKPGSFGIRGMRERAHAFGGDLEIGRAALGGTRVEAWLPATPAAPQPAASSASDQMTLL